MTELTPHQQQELSDYLDVLFWLETASVDEIQGALAVAQGVTKDDLELGIRSLMESDRPALATAFPHLLASRPTLNELGCRHQELANALHILSRSLSTAANPNRSPEGYGLTLGCLRNLHCSGVISAAQREVLQAELADLIGTVAKT